MASSTARQPTLGDIFSNLNFVKFWAGQLISYLGDRIDQMAMIFLLTKNVTDPTVRATHMNMITFWASLPYVFLSPFAGPIIDRFDRRKIMIAMDVVRGLVIIGVLIAVKPGTHPNAVYAIVALIGCATCIFAPAKSAFVPEIVPPDHLLRANSVTSTMGTLMVLIGTVIGGKMVSELGYQNSFIIDSLTYFISAVLLVWIRMGTVEEIAARARQREIEREGGYFARLKDGFAFVGKNRVPGMSVLLDSWFFMVGGILFTLITEIVSARLIHVNRLEAGKTIEQQTVEIFGYACGCLGLGLATGGILTGRYGGRIPLRGLLSASYVGAALFIALLAMKPGIFGTFLLFGLIGYSGGGVVVSIETVLQKGVPDEMRGRVFALNSLLLNTMLLLSIAVGAYVASKQLLTIDQRLIAVSALAAVGSLIAFFGMPSGARLSTVHPAQSHP